MLDAKGRVVEVIKIASDISQEKIKQADMQGQIQAMQRSQAVIEFDMQGHILTANDNFLGAVGYSLEEIRGQHHSMFVAKDYAQSPEYRQFWADLNQGKFSNDVFCRYGKGGREIWIQATYNPILDADGKPFKVVKFATDVTEQKKVMADYTGQIEAINRSQAVIHFDLDGNILTANDIFLTAMGYTLDEVKGRQHRMFVDNEYAQSTEYQDFWGRLRAGEFFTNSYRRIGKGGKGVWIQAIYSPIRDANGRVYKIVKYASDITQIMIARREAARSAQETVANVQAVAAASEELNASVSEIARNVAMAKGAVDDMNSRVGEADQSTRQMQQAATAMDNIVQLIQTIASQINLLALNATIESARAGEAGRGFAVVASEVKNLANQTAQATTQISEQIQSMQRVADAVSGALSGITQAIGSVTEVTSNVASAMEEQSAVTQEISSNMQTALSGVDQISASLNQMAQG